MGHRPAVSYGASTCCFLWGIESYGLFPAAIHLQAISNFISIDVKLEMGRPCGHPALSPCTVDGRIPTERHHSYLLGLDHERLTCRHLGRNFRRPDVAGEVVSEVLT
jgi:hypothetical protein